MASFSVILAAAGKSSRFKDQHYKKPFVPLANKAVWLHSAERFLNRDDVKQLILVIAQEDRESFLMKFGANVAILGLEVVEGGEDRSESVQAALSHVKSDIDFVVVHDAARPCLADEWIEQVFAAAEKSGAAILGTPVTSTLKRSSDGKSIDETVARDRLWEAQTPQVFRREWLLEAYAKRGESNATDDAQLVEQIAIRFPSCRRRSATSRSHREPICASLNRCSRRCPSPSFKGQLIRSPDRRHVAVGRFCRAESGDTCWYCVGAPGLTLRA